MSEGLQNTAFVIGDEIQYNRAGRIAKGTSGVVVGLREGSTWSVGVKFYGYAGQFYSLDGLDDTDSSLWCAPENLILCTSVRDDLCMRPDDLEDFLL